MLKTTIDAKNENILFKIIYLQCELAFYDFFEIKNRDLLINIY